MKLALPLFYYVALSLLIFFIGMLGFIRSHNPVQMLISIEVMLNAANLNFIAFAFYNGINPAWGSVAVIFSIGIAAAEAAVGLGIILAVFRILKTVDATHVSTLRG